MELLLLGASILIFRSVWLFIDSLVWARSGIGLIMLFIAGLFGAIFALKKIHLEAAE